MPNILVDFLVALLGLAGVAEPGDPATDRAATSVPMLVCTLTIAQTGNRQLIEAVVLAGDAPVSGELAVVVTGQGRNSLRLNQSRTIALQPSESLSLSQTLGGNGFGAPKVAVSFAGSPLPCEE